MQLPGIGEVIAEKYRVEELLGEGGFGCVFRGTTIASNRTVAIKVLKPTKGSYVVSRVRRFMREMQAIARLQSPYTLTLFDCGETTDGLLFMVTEFIDGQDLNEVLASHGTLSERETAHIVMQVLLSLKEAHESGILHRDIKPGNIRIFEYESDALRAKLLDFGLAHSLENDQARLTGTGKVIGTPRYMSPERIIGEELTPATDIYSLGLVARECVLGREAVLDRRSRELEEQDSVSPAFRQIVNAMLEAEPQDRPQSAWAVYERFREQRPGFDQLVPPPRPATVVEPPGPRAEPANTGVTTVEHADEPRINWGAVLGLAAVVCIVGVAVVHFSTPEPPPPPADVTYSTAPNPLVVGQLEDLGRPGRDLDQPVTEGSTEVLTEDGCGNFDGQTGVVMMPVSTGVLSAPTEVPVYVPKNYNPDEKTPLIVAFRDFRSGHRTIIYRARLNRLAEHRRAIVVAPTDVGNLAGVWESEEDIDRAKAAVATVKARYCIHEAQIFAYGHGMGGRAVRRLACEFPIFAATATTSYRPPKTSEPCDHETPIPHISFDPQLNPRAPAEGGQGCGIVDPVISTNAYEKQLRREAGCTADSRTWFEHDNGTCRTWTCEAAPLVTCRIQGGREFKGKPRGGLPIESQCDGEPVEFPYTTEMWRFFRGTVRDE